ncbi:hypothetical protein EVAR_84932_1 [Eumeta japonica]|uniref:Uncharacterized protein n=1 Tax=Eumeta variegata TaxID=151549 RepID=A0A4C1VJR4_EUMVA|nr:hypothetical protein EVAR_84932_1 [Eumeta japonica]
MRIQTAQFDPRLGRRPGAVVTLPSDKIGAGASERRSKKPIQLMQLTVQHAAAPAARCFPVAPVLCLYMTVAWRRMSDCKYCKWHNTQ